MAEIEIEDIVLAIQERIGMQTPWRGESPPPALDLAATEQIGRIKTNMHVIARTRDKLPPIMTYRRGWAARLELWLKHRLKKLTRWYTWEQVNFNSAVHGAFEGVCAALTAQAQHLSEMQDLIDAGMPPVTAAQSQIDTLAARLTSLEGRFAALLADEFEKLRAEQKQHLTLARDEQRVNFKQMALEISEAAVVADRARRSLQLRFEEMATQVEELRAMHAEIEHLRRATRAAHSSP